MHDRLTGLLGALGRLTDELACVVEAQVSRTLEFYRSEVRRTASVFALSMAAAILGCASVAFVALSVMIAFWPKHPVIASAAIAAGLAVLSALAVTLARGRRQIPESSRRR
jgi:hypothetical protein